MPGILPMKVIRVGSAQRIAQACDRCRSKKIKCDGIRPICSQCQNVGFECKTSDKLSRRAFPRGYTESLEDRVRGLEAEVRELKDLLDEKDEKIDVLSRIHDFSSPSRKASSSLSSTNAANIKAEATFTRQDVMHVESADPPEVSIPISGSSSTHSFIGAFERKIQQVGRSDVSISSNRFKAQRRPTSSGPMLSPESSSRIPPRLLSDQYINLFFQEWQPLLPVFHRPTFLRVYEQYLNNPEPSHWITKWQAYAQLHLIFDIAALSSGSGGTPSRFCCEPQWRRALHSISSTACVASIQCQVLAQLFYLLTADYSRVGRHRAVAVSMCHELGLHQDHRYKALPSLEAETRRKIFWCQYTLDRFASAANGIPILLYDRDITVQYPADVDDANISTHGITLALSEENTKISSALELFKVAKVLGKVLEELYPSKANYKLSVSKLHMLSEELDQWSAKLPTHLKLKFVKDKPSTNVISCRSPLLSLAYFYIRNLIHRPLGCHGAGSAASASTMALATAAKHTFQILELLEERRMNYTFPLSKTELLLCSGFSLLWQCVDLEEDGKIVKDNQKTLGALTGMLTRDSRSAGEEFLCIGNSVAKISACRSFSFQSSRSALIDGASARSLSSVPAAKQSATKKGLLAIAARFPSFSNRSRPEDDARGSTVPCKPGLLASPNQRACSTLSLSLSKSTPPLPASSHSPNTLLQTRTMNGSPNVNLDYLPLGEDESITQSSANTTQSGDNQPKNSGLGNASWEQLLTNIDNDFTGIYDAHVSDSIITSAAVSPEISSNPKSTTNSREYVPSAPLPSDGSRPLPASIDLSTSTSTTIAQSVLSLSEESLTSAEDLILSAAGSDHGSTGTIESADSSKVNISSEFKGIAMPSVVVDDDFSFGSEFDGHC